MEKRLPLERYCYVVDNLNLVHHILQSQFHIKPYYEGYEDYFQEGCIGLIKAAIVYDDSMSKFSTLAYPYIVRLIQRYKREKLNLVKIPRSSYDVFAKVLQLSAIGYELKDIVDITGFNEKDIVECFNAKVVESLDLVIPGKEEGSTSSADMYSIIPDSHNYYAEILSKENIEACITKTLECLKGNQRDVYEEYIWAMYFGEKLNQEYFAHKYHVSQPQVSRILKRGNSLLSKYLIESN